ncbi:hypothetical protein [Simplicispira psychrophila]|uniref:hypothetical protein n=1 Tax=Simplicispira psychrophila TaxID=80882 RepID=UPI00068C302A|nr:hypothetical protein [Simplicispira psychrophila]
MNRSGRAHCAPPVRYPVARSRWLASALALYAFAGGLALLGWAAVGAGTHWRWISAASALWIVCSVLAGWFWRTAPCGTLVWNGLDWMLESPQGVALCAPCTCAQVHFDLQRRLWLRLQPDTGRALWLWLEWRSQPTRWDDLRRAVYSAVGSGGPDTRRFAPPDDPQA